MRCSRISPLTVKNKHFSFLHKQVKKHCHFHDVFPFRSNFRVFHSQCWPVFINNHLLVVLQRSIRCQANPTDLDQTVMESGVINKLLMNQSLIRLMAPQNTHMAVKHSESQRRLLGQVQVNWSTRLIYAWLLICVDFNNDYIIRIQGWIAGDLITAKRLSESGNWLVKCRT